MIQLGQKTYNLINMLVKYLENWKSMKDDSLDDDHFLLVIP